MTAPLATVVIPTKNRREDILRALASCERQTVPLEIIVCDDASTDGTSEAVKQQFPRVIVLRTERSLGSTINRNRAVERATTPFIFSIDDDSEFLSPRTVEQTLIDFDHPRVGAVAIPFVNIKYSPDVYQRAPDPGGVYVIHEYRGCAAAWRRDLYRHVGGYSRVLGHMVEEPELCLRFMGKGYVVRMGRADHVVHLQSPRRDERHQYYLQARNVVLLAWINAPLPDALWAVPGAAVGAVVNFGLRLKAGRVALSGVLNAARVILAGKAPRCPVPRRAWRAWQGLKKGRNVPLEQIAHQLPPLTSDLPARTEANTGDAALAGGAWSTH